MPSGETLRFTLVCKLPLLHFSHSRVAVVQRFGFRFSTLASSLPLVRPSEDALSSRPCSRFPSSSAPAFSPARPLARMLGSVRVTSAASQLPQFLGVERVQLSLFGFPVGSERFSGLFATPQLYSR